MTIGTTMLFIFWSVVINQDDDGGFSVGPPERAPEQIMYVNPMVGMLDVVANTEPGGFGGINQMLAQLRGEYAELRRRRRLRGRRVPADRPVRQPRRRRRSRPARGYWWPRVAITFVIVAALLTLAAMRFVVPAGMRWAFRRRRRQPVGTAQVPGAARPAEGAPIITGAATSRAGA